MKYFYRFFTEIQQDLKAFAFWCVLFTIYRIIFIWTFSSQLNGDYSSVPLALGIGFRLSMKTAGYITLFSFAFATLPKVMAGWWPSRGFRLFVHGVAILIFSICFMARIPYYRAFNAAFNIMLINGAHDDILAIIITVIKEYQLLWRLPFAIITGLFIICMLELFLATRTYDAKKFSNPWLAVIGTAIFVPVFAVFVRFGGVLDFTHSINWENAARLSSNLLNEAVLDDGQALYRVHSIKRVIDRTNDVDITSDEFRANIAMAGGDASKKSLQNAFLRTVVQPKLDHQPKQVVLLVGESFGNWPFMPQFSSIGLVDKMMALQNSPKGAHIATALPHGSGTIMAVNGLVTGLAESTLYENYQKKSFRTKYETGIGYIMKQLGYKTVFWYGGFAGWQNIKDFALSQSFDEFYCAEDFGRTKRNAWGVEDTVLFQRVEEYMAQQPADSKVFHVVLTTSNHPPYSVNVKEYGYDKNAVKSKLPDSIAGDSQILKELGHIWYADKTMGDFVEQVERQNEDTLFVITGDHSERFSFAIEQDDRTMSTIPMIFYGAGVTQDLFDAQSMGVPMQMAGTLAEMIAPAGFTYTAILPNMFEEKDFVFNHRLFIQNGQVHDIKADATKEQYRKIKAVRNMTAWRVLNGNTFK